MSKIFVSYRRDDSADVTGRIHDRLRTRFGEGNVFKDVDSIPFGVDFRKHLQAAVNRCDVLLAVIGDRWCKITDQAGKRRLDDPTDFVRIEIESAIERQIPVIPLLVRGASIPAATELPASLQALVYHNGTVVRADPDFHRDMDRVINALEQHLHSGVAAGQEIPALPQQPMMDSLVATNSLGMKLAYIPVGEFLMGSPGREEARNENEGPQHRVQISKPFYLGVYQVTQEEYQRVMGQNPSWFCGTGGGKAQAAGQDTRRFPVESVSWDEALEFCRRLSAVPGERRAGRVYRLPTEAEWEYACRAGTTTPFYFDTHLSSTQANFDGNFPYGGGDQGPFLGRTTTVGSYMPNAFGVYDMHGNVWEWCADWFGRDYAEAPALSIDPQGPPTGSYHIMRGGGWGSHGRNCRAAYRSDFTPAPRFSSYGFRVWCGR